MGSIPTESIFALGAPESSGLDLVCNRTMTIFLSWAMVLELIHSGVALGVGGANAPPPHGGKIDTHSTCALHAFVANSPPAIPIPFAILYQPIAFVVMDPAPLL